MVYKLDDLCLEITNQCPLDCAHCSGNLRMDPPAHLTFRTCSKVISDFVHLGGRLLEISGGEPLTHKDLIPIIRRAKTHKLEVCLYTSGMNNHAPISIEIARVLKLSGLDKIIFSLEGATQRTHESITGMFGCFDSTLEGIRSTKASGIWTGVHFVPMKPNVDELEKLVKLCAKLKVDELGLLRFVPQGNGRTNRERLELSTTEFSALIQNIIKLRADHPEVSIRTGCPLDFASIMGGTPLESCKVGRSTCVVKPNGDVMPCPALKREKTALMGNIHDEPLTKIWANNARWKPFRKFDYNRMDYPCVSCKTLPLCKGGCVAQRILEYGDMYAAPDPACPITERPDAIPARTPYRSA